MFLLYCDMCGNEVDEDIKYCHACDQSVIPSEDEKDIS